MTTIDPRTIAGAAVAHMPAASPLAAGAPGSVNPALFSSAAVAELVGAPGALVGVVVGADLVAALQGTPLGDLSLADAVQPALDAAATQLGLTARAAQVLDPADALARFTGDHVAVSLVDGSGAERAALLLSAAVLGPQPATGTVTAGRGIEMLHGVVLDVTVELGRTRMSVRDVLSLAPGAVLELDRAAGSPADLLVNGRLIARGEVVVVDEDFGLRITEVIDPQAGA